MPVLGTIEKMKQDCDFRNRSDGSVIVYKENTNEI